MPDDLRARFLARLSEQTFAGRYPSVTMLDRVERAVRDRESAERYVSELMDSVGEDTYPSPQMLDRLERLLDALDAVPPGE